MDYSFAQLHAFATTVETGSFKLAAIELDKRSQAVAKLVALLEENCNVTLFIRHVRRLEVTDEGKKLYQLAKRVIKDTHHIDMMINSFEQALPKSFTLAIDSLMLCPEVVACYKAVLTEIPTLDLEILTGSTLQVTKWVKQGKAEMAIRFSPFQTAEDLVSLTAFNFKTVDVASAKTLTQGEVVSIDKLAHLTQIVPKFVIQYGHDKQHIFSDTKIISNNVQQSLAMVEADMGWMNVPRFLVREEIASGKLIEISIEGSVAITWMAEIIYLDEDKLTLAADIFIQQVQKLDHAFSQNAL